MKVHHMLQGHVLTKMLNKIHSGHYFFSLFRLAPLILSGHSPGGCSNGGRVGRLICIDSPGHGLSSHYPPGMEYNMLDCLTHIRRVVAHFKLEKFSLIGHSLGKAGRGQASLPPHPIFWNNEKQVRC